MTNLVHNSGDLTDAVIAVLEAAAMTVGDGEKPDAGGWQGAAELSPFVGYVVVHPLAGGVTDGSIDEPEADAEPLYQLSTYGATRAQCEAVQDRARAAMLAATITLAGRRVQEIEIEMLGGARREDALQPPLWVGVERFRIPTTPL